MGYIHIMFCLSNTICCVGHVCRKSVRRRVTKRKSKQQAATNGPEAPPTIREESPSPVPPAQTRKLSEPLVVGVSTTKHVGPARKLSDGSVPALTQVLDQSLQRKISLDAALSGVPKIAANGALVHELNKATLTTSTGAVDSDVEDHEYTNIDTQSYLREKRQKKLREMQERMDGESPTTSDSEVERDTSSSWTGGSSFGGSAQKGMQGSSRDRIRKWERRLSSDSEDSISSPTRRPVATPRSKKPDLKPKPKEFHVPPRPRMSQIDRARGKVNTGAAAASVHQEVVPTQADQQPRMPLRPRGTEIRRARQQVRPTNSSPLSQTPRSPPSSTPTITATNDKGDQRVVLPSTKDSAFKPVSNQRSPGLAMVREEKSEYAGMTPSALGLKAGKHRSPRAKSPTRTPSPSVSVDERPEDAGTTPSALSLKAANHRPHSPRGKSPSRTPSPSVSVDNREGAGTTPSALGLKAANRRSRSPRGKSPSRTPSPSVSVVSDSLALPKSSSSSRKERSHSESDAQDTPPSPSSSSPTSSPMTSEMTAGGNPFNQQMAETLVKYILASQDSGLKNALRECIMQSPEAVKSLQK